MKRPDQTQSGPSEVPAVGKTLEPSLLSKIWSTVKGTAKKAASVLGVLALAEAGVGCSGDKPAEPITDLQACVGKAEGGNLRSRINTAKGDYENWSRVCSSLDNKNDAHGRQVCGTAKSYAVRFHGHVDKATAAAEKGRTAKINANKPEEHAKCQSALQELKRDKESVTEK